MQPTALLPATLSFCACLAYAGSAHAERGFVITAGGDAVIALPEADYSEASSSPHAQPFFGYFGRLSYETAVPAYTTAERGYRWAFGLDPDFEFARSRQAEGGQSSTIAAGLRLSVAFSQKRMGLLEVSARGGFYLALRAGLQHNEDESVVLQTRPIVASAMRPAPQADGLGDVSVGEFFLLGDSGLRFEMEFSMLMAEPAPDSDDSGYGLRMRSGLGAYF